MGSISSLTWWNKLDKTRDNLTICYLVSETDHLPDRAMVILCTNTAQNNDFFLSPLGKQQNRLE